eukprot:354025-Chlamydomonas_euryale.AAC.1
MDAAILPMHCISPWLLVSCRKDFGDEADAIRAIAALLANATGSPAAAAACMAPAPGDAASSPAAAAA